MTWSRRWRRDRDGIVPAQALDRIRYRICKIAEDIIKLEEMLGYLLEALDVIEIPPEPPEQAGRSLYERLGPYMNGAALYKGGSLGPAFFYIQNKSLII